MTVIHAVISKLSLPGAEIIFRRAPDFFAYASVYLASAAHDQEGRLLLVQKLASNPKWRRDFFDRLPSLIKETSTGLQILSGLKDGGYPIAIAELIPYLDALIAVNRADTAYNLWLSTLPKEQLDSLGLLANPGFETDPDGSQFDWRILPGSNAVAEFERLQPKKERILHIRFEGGRVHFPEVRQVLVLRPGSYQLIGKLKGKMRAKRGLRWQLRCAAPPYTQFGQTDMFVAQSEQWLPFALHAAIPANTKCPGQLLHLFHYSGSPYGETISGEVSFASLAFERVGDDSHNWLIGR